MTRLDAPTEELGPLGERIARQARTAAQAMPVQAPAAPLSPPQPAAAGERCAACGAVLASDQRYCVECGQRLGRARLPFMDDPARPFARPSDAPFTKRRMSVNSTLIAGVGTLLLAMGIGILIGRSSPGSSATSAGPVQVLTVPAGGTAGAASATEAPSAAGDASTTSTGSLSPSKNGKTPAESAAKPKLPEAKVVTVGSAGKGKGYENGHFTGNFFGKGEE